ncbi:MAG: DUF4340 domain-containing protein [Candidatus Omnitrophica bacterium]|nr:DUF4340 domain-containing protein [Candidatus Omnitrophota bacterium]
MRWKTTLALLVATVVVGAYVAYDIRQPSKEWQEERPRQILDLPAETITQLAIETPQVKIALIKDGGSWVIAPQHLRANANLITRIVYLFGPLMASRVLAPTPEHPLDLAAMGLAPAVGRITVSANGLASTLQFGNPTPLPSKRYAKVAGRPEVFVIPARLFDLVNQPLERYRDSPSAAPANEAPGAEDALQDGQMRQPRQEYQGPPEPIVTERTPRQELPRQQPK